MRSEIQWRHHQTIDSDTQVPGKGKRGDGESELFQFRGPAWLRREISKMIEAKKFPHLETASDLMRQAVINEVEYLMTIGYVSTSVWGQMRIMDDLNSQKRQELRFNKVAQDFQANIRGYWEEGATAECRSMIARFEYYINQMPECRFKEKWKRELKKYEHMKAEEVSHESK